MMEVEVTTFRNPFSFFCLPSGGAVANAKDTILPQNNYGSNHSKKFDLSGIMHGEYVAVLWNDQWARGIISMETKFLIWLVDYGMYLRPNERTVYVNLPPEDKKYPTKVFEASIHGVTPVDKIMTEMCELKDDISFSWSNGAIEKAQSLLSISKTTYFVPVAVMSTKINDVVIGDLYLRITGRGVVNLKDVLEEWPVFLQKDPEIYVDRLSKFYTHRRQHRASHVKPPISAAVPTITPDISLADYSSICGNAPELYLSECDDTSEEGSTLTYLETACPLERNSYQPTPEEIEKYSNTYIMVSGREYNVLNVLCNKARDLYLCEKYADQKYIGRATSRSRRLGSDINESA